MTSTIGSLITSKVIGMLAGADGVPDLNAAQVRAQNVSPDIADRSLTMHYPAVYVYCEKITNSLTEKFRTFSGSVQTVVELRNSQDRLEGLQDSLENYADGILRVLNGKRGDWGDGMFYAGEYQAVFGPVKHGGRNFLQSAKITFEIGVSRS